MNDLLIDADAGTGGKSAISQKGGSSSALGDVMMDNLINVLGTHAFPNRFTAEKQSLTGNAPGSLHGFNLRCVFYQYHKSLRPESSTMQNRLKCFEGEAGGILDLHLTNDGFQLTRSAVVILQGSGL